MAESERQVLNETAKASHVYPNCEAWNCFLIMDSDENGLYFLTAKGKGLYDRLKKRICRINGNERQRYAVLCDGFCSWQGTGNRQHTFNKARSCLEPAKQNGLEKPYAHLLNIVKGKGYFVLTTNVGHQFQLAGFDKKRLFYAQGDYGLWQCSKACHDKTYDREEIVRRMVATQKNLKIPSELIPKCPVCGGKPL